MNDPELCLERFIADNPDLERLEDLIADFNFFDLLGIQTRETRHSAFLAWMLDPAGNHGLGEYFLRRFLMLVTKRARDAGINSASAFDVDNWRLAETAVFTERHNIDILLVSQRDQFVCVIENKLFSGEHDDQLRRYRETVGRQYPTLKPIFVLLSVGGGQAASDEDASHYVPIGYPQIAELIDGTLSSRAMNLGPDVSSALRQYLATLRRHVLSDSEIVLLARKIYQNHKAAIDLIVESRPDTQSEIKEIIDACVNACQALGLDESSKSYIRCFDPRWDAIPGLLEGQGWTRSHRLVLLEFRNYAESLSLDLVLGPGPGENRRRIFDAALGEAQPLRPSRRTLSNSWATLYQKPVLQPQDYEERDLEAISKKVYKAVDEMVSQDLDEICRQLNLASREG